MPTGRRANAAAVQDIVIDKKQVFRKDFVKQELEYWTMSTRCSGDAATLQEFPIDKEPVLRKSICKQELEDVAMAARCSANAAAFECFMIDPTAGACSNHFCQ